MFKFEWFIRTACLVYWQCGFGCLSPNDPLVWKQVKHPACWGPKRATGCPCLSFASSMSAQLNLVQNAKWTQLPTTRNLAKFHLMSPPSLSGLNTWNISKHVHLLTSPDNSKNSWRICGVLHRVSLIRRRTSSVLVFLGQRHLSLSVLEETVQRGLDTHKLSYARLCCYASRSSWGAHYKCWWNGCKRRATIVSLTPSTSTLCGFSSNRTQTKICASQGHLHGTCQTIAFDDLLFSWFVSAWTTALHFKWDFSILQRQKVPNCICNWHGSTVGSTVPSPHWRHLHRSWRRAGRCLGTCLVQRPWPRKKLWVFIQEH